MDEAPETADPLVSPRQIALTYDRVVSAHWRGETDTASALDAWFEAHWSDQAPPEPEAPPEGTSVLGDSGAGIRWYVCDDVVLGFVSRRPDGCYRVPMREAVPSLQASWDLLELEATRQPDTDDLVQHTGMKPLPASLDHRASSESDAGEQHARASKQGPAQQSADAETLVTVHVLERSAAENPPGVAAGS
jgi:hypothetical protein